VNEGHERPGEPSPKSLEQVHKGPKIPKENIPKRLEKGRANMLGK